MLGSLSLPRLLQLLPGEWQVSGRRLPGRSGVFESIPCRERWLSVLTITPGSVLPFSARNDSERSQPFSTRACSVAGDYSTL